MSADTFTSGGGTGRARVVTIDERPLDGTPTQWFLNIEREIDASVKKLKKLKAIAIEWVFEQRLEMTRPLSELRLVKSNPRSHMRTIKLPQFVR